MLSMWRHYPTDWSKYEGKHLGYFIPPQFMNPTETYRFGARYRAAKAYKGSKFAGYSSGDTAKGYTALVALMLAFSAFEYFYKEVLNLDVPGMTKLLNDEHKSFIVDRETDFDVFIKTADAELLFKTIRRHLNKAHQISIDKMLSETETNLIRVLAAIRHAFIHGHLTPNIKGVEPTTVIELCRFGYSFLMDAMDIEFSRRINWMVT